MPFVDHYFFAHDKTPFGGLLKKFGHTQANPIWLVLIPFYPNGMSHYIPIPGWWFGT
jgi:hypothetical protein